MRTTGPATTVSRSSRAPAAVYAYLAIVVLTWAGNWPLMKLALGQVPPLKFVLFRLLGSLVLIAPPLALGGNRVIRLGRFVYLGATQREDRTATCIAMLPRSAASGIMARFAREEVHLVHFGSG